MHIIFYILLYVFFSIINKNKGSKLIFIFVASGGALGSITRYLFGVLFQTTKNGFPLSTFLVNVLGSFVIGILFYYLKDSNNENLKAFLTVGFLGGFTTFSAFSVDIMNLIYDKDYFTSILYILGTVSLSIISVFFGFWVTKFLSV